MDNKKWYNRFATIFWWALTILPLIVAFIYFIGYHFTFNSGITSANELATYHQNFKNFSLFFDNTFKSQLGAFIPGFIKSLSNDLFITLFGYDSALLQAFCLIFAWGVWVQFIHLMFDFIVWLPKFFHSLLEKGVGKID